MNCIPLLALEQHEAAQRIEKQDIITTLGTNLRQHLIKAGFDEIYGARPLRRLINELVIDEIALQLLEGKIKPKDKLTVDYINNKVLIDVQKVN